MHTLLLFCPTPCMPSPYFVPPHAYPSPILSHPMHALPLFYPTHACPPPILFHPCMPSPILSHPMHTLPLFYPSSCTSSPYSMPAYTHPTLFYSTPCMPSLYSIPHIHALLYSIPLIPRYACPLLFSTSPHMHPQYSIPPHACPPNSLSHEPRRQVSPLTSENTAFESVHTEYIIIIYLA